MVSKLKAENVLNPPQNPVIISMRIDISELNLSPRKKTVNPSTIQLRRLERSVAAGKTLFPKFIISNEIPKRRTLPMPPPRKT
jgi:hypothetical protein